MLIRISLLVAVCCTGLAAQDRFVSTAGSDANPGTEASPWRTVTYAAANAPSGSTIHIAAGTYGTGPNLEGIEVSGGKVLSFRGRGAGQTIIKANAGFSRTIPYFFTTRTWTAVFIIHGVGTDVTIRDMTIDANHLTASRLTTVIYSDGADGHVDHCELTNAGATVINGAQGHLGFMAVGKDNANPSMVKLTYSHVNGFNKNGVMMFGEGLNGVIDNCSIEGAGIVGGTAAAQNGVQFGPRGVSYQCKNTVIRNIWYGPTTWNSVGLLVFDSRATTTVEHNEVLDCKTALYHVNPASGLSSFSRNTVANCMWGINVFSAGATASSNDFDANVSVYVDPGYSLLMGGNAFSDWRSNAGYSSGEYRADGNPGSVDYSPVSGPGFEAPVNVVQPSGSGPSSIVVDDFNNDNVLDFAVANRNENKVRVYFGSGGSDFTTIPATNFSVSDGPMVIASGEFDGDVDGGGRDLVVVNEKGKVFIYENENGTKFKKRDDENISGLGLPTSIAVGQLNAADEDDIVVGYAGASANANGGVRVLTVRDGKIKTVTSPPGTFRRVDGVGLARLNGDTKLDLFFTDASNNLGASNKLRVLFHSVTPGVFSPATSYSIGALGRGASAGDIDGDGDNDIAVATGGDPGGVHLFENPGTGILTEAAKSPFRVGRGAQSVRILDLQNDGDFDQFRGDIAVLHPVLNKLTRLRSYVGGRFVGARGCYTLKNPLGMASGMFDADKIPDLVIASKDDNRVTVMIGEPDALSQSYGTGCPGFRGWVPQAYASGTPPRPVLGNAGFGFALRHARRTRDAALILTVGENATLPACGILPGKLFFLAVRVTSADGFALVSVPVPNIPAIAGQDFFAQWGVLDEAGGFFGTFALSQPMRFRLGNN